MQQTKINAFQKKIWDYYDKHKRPMLWRVNTSPYFVVVSEIMLQQTQVSRVSEIFPYFIKKFPSCTALAKASPEKVLAAWRGLGYNRRALYLHRSAQTIVKEYKNKVPQDLNVLQNLPGIGPNTAASICAFAFNQPVVFIETNIRSVFIHHFFKNSKKVSDTQIIPYVRETLDTKNPREWYWALMDYGSMLKKQNGNPNKKSAHYIKQKTFKNSNRQLRGAILKELLNIKNGRTQAQLTKKLHKTAEELKKPLMELCTEGFIQNYRRRYFVR